MSVKYAPSKLRVPDGFQYLLEGLAREVLREQPENIIQFAAKYFSNRLKERESAGQTASSAENDASSPAVVVIDVAPETTKEEEAAAIKIQSLIRGAKARKEVNALKSSSSASVTFEDGGVGAGTVEPAAEEAVAADPPANDVVEDTTVSNEAPPVTEAEAAELDPELADVDLNDKDLLVAATKIQATFRGHKGRKQADDVRKTSSKEIETSGEDVPAGDGATTEVDDPPANEAKNDAEDITEAAPVAEVTEVTEEKKDEPAAESVEIEIVEESSPSIDTKTDIETAVETAAETADVEIADAKPDTEAADTGTDAEAPDTKPDTEANDNDKTEGENVGETVTETADIKPEGAQSTDVKEGGDS